MKFIILAVCISIQVAISQQRMRFNPDDFWVAPTNPDTQVELNSVGYNNTDDMGPMKAGFGWYILQDTLIIKNRMQIDFERVEWVCIHFNKYDTMVSDNLWFGRVNDTTIRFKDSFGTCDPADTPPDAGWGTSVDANDYDWVDMRQVDTSVMEAANASFYDIPQAASVGNGSSDATF